MKTPINMTELIETAQMNAETLNVEKTKNEPKKPPIYIGPAPEVIPIERVVKRALDLTNKVMVLLGSVRTCSDVAAMNYVLVNHQIIKAYRDEINCLRTELPSSEWKIRILADDLELITRKIQSDVTNSTFGNENE